MLCRSKEERIEHKKRHIDKRDKYELEHCGGYTRIYPDLTNSNTYMILIDAAKEMWNEFYISKKFNKKIELDANTKHTNRIIGISDTKINAKVGRKSQPAEKRADSRMNKKITLNEFQGINKESGNKSFLSIKKEDISFPPIQKTLEKNNKSIG